MRCCRSGSAFPPWRVQRVGVAVGGGQDTQEQNARHQRVYQCCCGPKGRTVWSDASSHKPGWWPKSSTAASVATGAHATAAHWPPTTLNLAARTLCQPFVSASGPGSEGGLALQMMGTNRSCSLSCRLPHHRRCHSHCCCPRQPDISSTPLLLLVRGQKKWWKHWKRMVLTFQSPQ